jgi:hypothetical protein
LTFRSTRPLLLTISIIPILALTACDSAAPATPTAGSAAIATAVATPSAIQATIPATITPVATATFGAVATSIVGAVAAATATIEAATSTVAGPATSGGVVTAIPTSSGPAQDTAVVAAPTVPTEMPAPTSVSATATGADVTALTALGQLKPKALAWQPDARLVMMANVRPGQADKLLGVALGDPNVNEPTPGGLGRNWALIVFSPSSKGAIVLTMDGTQTDLVKEGALTDNMLQSFGSPGMQALDLSKLDVTKLTDSDKLPSKAGATGQLPSAGIALLAPDGLGLGPLPTPKAGGSSPQIAYELFSADPSQQNFLFFDAVTGAVVMDSTAP